jgi:hypothetical protein
MEIMNEKYQKRLVTPVRLVVSRRGGRRKKTVRWLKIYRLVELAFMKFKRLLFCSCSLKQGLDARRQQVKVIFIGSLLFLAPL